MISAATAPFPVPFPGRGIWIEGAGRTDDRDFPRTLVEAKKEDATTLDDSAILMLQTRASTVPITNSFARSRFDWLFRSVRGAWFEDGMDSYFSNSLTSLVQTYGPFLTDILAQIFEDNTISSEALSEALRWLGRMKDHGSYEARLWLLERALTSPSVNVRDGACLGLASMDDPRSTPYLEAAIEAEKVPGLRRDMEEVLGQLKNRR